MLGRVRHVAQALSEAVPLSARASHRTMSAWGRLSSTSGADGFPWVNASRAVVKPLVMVKLAAPVFLRVWLKDNSLGTPSQRHWEEDWSTADIQQAAEEHVMLSWSNSSPDLPVFERSEGVYLYDSNGKRYLDWTSQAVCVNLGYTVPESIKDRADHSTVMRQEAIHQQLDSLPYLYGGLGLAPVRAKLARLMAEICPGDLNGFLFPSGGGEANEAAIRMARLYTGKQKIFTQYRSYHGGSTSSLGATGDFRRRFTESNTHGFVKFFNPQPSGHWADQILAEGPDTIAAIMVESIVGAGGVLVPPEGYIEGVRSLCDKYDILMICDEVMVGFGRTGHFFAFQHFEGVIPDMVTSAKGLTGSYLPLSMVGVRQKIKNYFWEKPVGWGATYHAHPVAVACAYETVEGTAVKFLKQRLAEQIGVSRFRQRWFSHDYTEFQDDDELTLDLDVQVIVLDFMTPLPEDRMQLALACAANGSLVLEALLRDRCLPPDAADECGQTALQVAASKGHLDCMSLLLEAGADQNKQDSLGQTALHLASEDRVGSESS
eukprot:g13570.t1